MSAEGRKKNVLKTGVKLWSVNTGAVLNEVRPLIKNGTCDYLELYAVPGTLDTLPQWKALGIPTIIHAPHFKHGFNLALREHRQSNRRLYEETRRFADELGASHIIFHGGTFGCIEETAQQLAELNEPRALIENKPAITRNNGSILECRGSTLREIQHVLNTVGCGFCLDIPHALCAANYHALPADELLAAFRALEPAMFHLADMMTEDLLIDDHTQLGLGCLNFRRFIPGILTPGATVTIETNRRHPDTLEEFKDECSHLREILRQAGLSA